MQHRSLLVMPWSSTESAPLRTQSPILQTQSCVGRLLPVAGCLSQLLCEALLGSLTRVKLRHTSGTANMRVKLRHTHAEGRAAGAQAGGTGGAGGAGGGAGPAARLRRAGGA